MKGCYVYCTDTVLAQYFKKLLKDKNHGPFSWGKDAKEVVHNAVVLEEVAKMAYRTELIHP